MSSAPAMSPDQLRAEADRLYNAELIRRYKRGMPLTKADKAYARKLVKALDERIDQLPTKPTWDR